MACLKHITNSCKWPTWRTILFSICLFQFSTCFEQPRVHYKKNQLYQYNIWYVSLCRWPSSMQVLPELHTRRSPTQSDTYQMLYWYNWFSWWWARVCSQHVDNWNKHTEKRTVHQVGHLQELNWDARSTDHKKHITNFWKLYVNRAVQTHFWGQWTRQPRRPLR
jgi:hypothetical protein